MQVETGGEMVFWEDFFAAGPVIFFDAYLTRYVYNCGGCLYVDS